MRANLVALALAASAAHAEPVVIDISAEHVVGVSAIEVTDAGAGFLAVSDAGWFLEGTLSRENGALVAGEITDVSPIIGQNGFPVRARRVGDWSDAEGLALLPDGTIYVSFERWARVARHDRIEDRGQWIKDHPEFITYSENRQLEALAVDADGLVYTLAEKPDADRMFQVFRLEDEGWAAFTRLPASQSFWAVGADFGPDGRFYLLERKLAWGLWWHTRLRRFDLETGAEETLFRSRSHGNLEGVSVWAAPDGLRATLVSDNNGKEGVPTHIVELGLSD